MLVPLPQSVTLFPQTRTLRDHSTRGSLRATRPRARRRRNRSALVFAADRLGTSRTIRSWSRYLVLPRASENGGLVEHLVLERQMALVSKERSARKPKRRFYQSPCACVPLKVERAPAAERPREHAASDDLQASATHSQGRARLAAASDQSLEFARTRRVPEVRRSVATLAPSKRSPARPVTHAA